LRNARLNTQHLFLFPAGTLLSWKVILIVF